jgi:hypothetical protein
MRQYEDITSYRFIDQVMWWYWRSERVWVASTDGRKDLDDVSLDPLSYKVLFENEHVMRRGSEGFLQRPSGDPMRLKVDVVSWGSGDSVNVRLLSRQELSYMLQTNIVSGLLRGMTG